MEERDERWRKFLETIPSEDSNADVTLSTLFQDIIIENYLSIEISDSNDFTQLFRQVEQSIPHQWFLPNNDDTPNMFEEFSSCPILEPISERAKRKIWADTPRTFDIFSRKSSEIELMLSSDEMSTLYRAILCRILCTSSILLGGWYCQGMAFVAGSCMFYFKEFRKSEFDKISQQKLGIYSCGLYHYCFLKENHIEALYRDSVLLSAYMSELAYQLSMNPNTVSAYHHMVSIGFTVHFFALEWFTACFLLNVPHECSLLIHDILIYGQTALKDDILMKIGISIIAALSSKLLTYSCK